MLKNKELLEKAKAVYEFSGELGEYRNIENISEKELDKKLLKDREYIEYKYFKYYKIHKL